MVDAYYVVFVASFLVKCFLSTTDDYSASSNESSSNESLNYQLLEDDYGEMDLEYLRIGDDYNDPVELLDTPSSKLRKKYLLY